VTQDESISDPQGAAGAGADAFSSARDCAWELIQLLSDREMGLADFASKAVPHIQKLLARPDLLVLGVDRVTNHSDIASAYLYYDFDFHIIVGSHPRAGASIPVHDHGTWEILAVYRGEIEHTLYRQVDDSSKPGYAELEVVEKRLVGPMDVVAALPPDKEIHGFTITQPDTHVVVVVGGHFKPIRRYFQPDTHSYLERHEKSWRGSIR
jgi:predicted metal-dependent enzyme (double-stranded beta helix superfamily)